MTKATLEPRVWSKRYTMMSLLVLAIFLCYVDRVLISLAAVDMQKELGWNDADKGLVLSAFFMGYFVMQIGSGILAHRYGGRNILLIAVLLWSLFTVLTPPAAYISFTVLILVRFLLGVGEGAAYPAAYNLVYGWMKEAEISRSISIVTAAGTLGTVFAFLIVGKLIQQYGWQSVFYLFGSVGFFWAVFWIKYIPVMPGSDHASANSMDDKPDQTPIPWKLIFTRAPSLSLFTVAACFWGIVFTLASWLPSYYVDTFGVSLAQAGFYSVIPWVFISITTILSGFYADRLLKTGVAKVRVRKGFVGIATGGTSVFLAMLLTSPSLTEAVIYISAMFAMVGLIVPGYAPNAADLFPKHGAVVYGFLAATGSLSGSIVTALTGVVLENTGGYEGVFGLMIGLAVVPMLIYLLFGKADPVKK